MFVYKFVIRQSDGSVAEHVIAGEEGLAAAERLGGRYIQPCNRPGIRDELVGHPMFYGFNGPMYDGCRAGPHVIRYEGVEA